MSVYYVTVPVIGHVSASVEADSEDEAIEKLLRYDGVFSTDPDEDKPEEIICFHEVSYEMTEVVAKGNVFYGECSEAYAELAVD